MVLSNTDRGLIGMEVCLCMGVCVSLGDGGSVGSQGKRERLICVEIPSLVMRRPVSLDELKK